MTSLTRSALSGMAWNWGGSAVLAIAQTASTAATARLVSPKEFGVYATAQAAAGFAGYFSMAAVGQDLQRRSELGPKTVGTAASISLLSAGLIGLVFLLAAEPWAELWGVPQSAHIVRLFAGVVSLMALSTVPLSLLRRRLAFGRATVVETTSMVIGLSIGVALATALHSATALALGQVVGAFALTGSAAVLTRRDLRLRFDRTDARKLATFGGQIGMLGLGSYVANTAPSWFAARVFGASVLGLYSRAYLIVSLPATYAATSIFKVIYPLYGRVRTSPERTQALLRDALTLTTGTVWPFFALVAGAAPVIVEVLLGPRWSAAAPYVELVALGACANVPTALLTNAAEAIGWLKIVTFRLLTFLLAVGAAMLAVFVGDLELTWLLLGVALAQWLVYVLTLRPFIHKGLLESRPLAKTQAVHGATAFGAFGLAAGCTAAVSGAAAPVQAVATAAVGIGVAAALFIAGHRYPAGRILRARVAQTLPAARWPRAVRAGAASQ